MTWKRGLNRELSTFGGLYVVFKKNPFLPNGSFVRRFDDGYEKVIVGEEDGRFAYLGYEGLVIPHRVLAPFIMKVRARGVDMGAARQDRRRQMGE